MADYSDRDINNIIRILDNFSESEEGRMKLSVTERTASGNTERRYHHGRCDVGSPWARGDAFDVLE